MPPVDRKTPIAGFGVRLLAQIVDLCLWGALVSVVGVALVFLAPDTFGLASSYPERRSCETLTAIPPAISLAAALSPTSIEHCSKSFLGFRFRDEVTIEEAHGSGRLTTKKSATYTVGPDLAPKDAFDVDHPLWLAFFAYVVLAQGRAGATLGKHLFGLRVVGRHGQPPGLRAAAIRNAVLAGLWLLDLLPFTDRIFTGSRTWFALAIAATLAQLAVLVEVWWTARKGKPGIHDRLAGTRVVLLPEPNAHVG